MNALLLMAVACGVPLALGAWLILVVQPRDTRRFVEAIRGQEREIVALKAAGAPPWGCVERHDHEAAPCSPDCWLAQRDPGDPSAPEPTIELWNAINAYTEVCGGDTGLRTVGPRRMDAVVAVDRAVERLDVAPTVRSLTSHPGGSFVCVGCDRSVPWDEGSADEHPDLCDACWVKAEKGPSLVVFSAGDPL